MRRDLTGSYATNITGGGTVRAFIPLSLLPMPPLLARTRHPVLGRLDSLRQLCHNTGMTFPTATKAMLKSMELGIVRELTGLRRNRLFVYDGYLNILNEGGEAL